MGDEDHVCYELVGKTWEKTDVSYSGMVRVLWWQSNRQAVDWRFKKLISRPKCCLKDLDVGTAVAHPVGHKLTRPQALLQELVLTVLVPSLCSCWCFLLVLFLYRWGISGRGAREKACLLS